MKQKQKLQISILWIFNLTAAFAGSSSLANPNTEKSLEVSNLEKAIYCMKILEGRPDIEPSTRIEILRDQCFAEHYIQHSPRVEDGREAVLKLFSERYKKSQKTSISIKRTASEGDFVWIHMHFKPNPEHLGRAIVHIFRMKDGKLAEHWAVGQAVPETSKNSNTMF